MRIARGAAVRLEARGEAVEVVLRDRAGGEAPIEAGFVVNCTGPQASFKDTNVPLFENLLGRGLARPDALNLGIDVADDFAVIDGQGEPSEWLYAIGPVLRGTLWETTAVPELRGQAMRVAQVLLDREAEPVVIEEEGVLEYCI